jgi:hypothetical protein
MRGFAPANERVYVSFGAVRIGLAKGAVVFGMLACSVDCAPAGMLSGQNVTLCGPPLTLVNLNAVADLERDARGFVAIPLRIAQDIHADCLAGDWSRRCRTRFLGRACWGSGRGCHRGCGSTRRVPALLGLSLPLHPERRSGMAATPITMCDRMPTNSSKA